MAIRERATLKTWFKKHAYPKAEQFADWIDSFIHQNDTIPVQSVENLTDLLNDKMDVDTGAEIERKADEAIAGLNLHGEQIQQIIENTNEIEDTLDAHAARMDSHEGQLSALEATAELHGEQIAELTADVSGLQTTATRHGQKIGALETTAGQLRTDLTAETTARTNKDTELNRQITDVGNRVDALRGAFIYRGDVALNTASVTDAQLNARITALLSRAPALGDVLKDAQGMEWYFNGTNWLKMGHDSLPLASGTTAGIVADTGAGDLEYAGGVATVKASKRIANPHKLNMLVAGQTYQYDGTQAVNIDLSDIGTGVIEPEPEPANVYVIDSDAALAGLNDLDFSAVGTSEEWFAELIIKVKSGTWVYDGNDYGGDGIFINTTSWYKFGTETHHRAIQRVRIIGEDGARIVIKNACNGGYMLKAGYLSQPHPASGTVYNGGINASVHNLQLTFEGQLPVFDEHEYFDCLQGFVGIEGCLITGNVRATRFAGNYNNLVGIPINPDHKYCLSAANDCIYMRDTFLNETTGHLVGYMVHNEEQGAPCFDIPVVIENCKIHAFKGGVHIINDMNYWPAYDDFHGLNVTIRQTQFVQVREKYTHLYARAYAAVMVYTYTFAQTTIDGCHFLITGEETGDYATMSVMGCNLKLPSTNINGTNIYNSQFEVTGLSPYSVTIPLFYINRMQNSRVTNYMGYETPIMYAVGIRWCIGNTFEGGGELNSVSTDGTSYQTVIDGTPAGGFNQYRQDGF